MNKEIEDWAEAAADEIRAQAASTMRQDGRVIVTPVVPIKPVTINGDPNVSRGD